MRSYKCFWQGTSWVLSIPSSMSQSLGLKEGDALILKADTDKRTITIENPPPDIANEEIKRRPKKIDDNAYLIVVRVIGAEGAKGEYPYAQLGFTIPKDIADYFANLKFTCQLVEKSGKSFKIVYTPVEEVVKKVVS